MTEAAASAPANAGEGTPAPAKGSMLTRLAVLLFLVSVILGECLFAYLLIGRTGESVAAASSTDNSTPPEEEAASKGEHGKEAPKAEAKHGEAKAAKHGEAKEAKHGEAKEAKHGEAKEGKHGEAKEGGHGEGKGEGKAAAEPVLDADGQQEVDLEEFSVTAHRATSDTTFRMEFHLFGIIDGSDKEEFDTLLKANQRRFREQVLVIVRSAEPPDLADPELGLIKRQILEKTNRLLGKPLLKTIIITDFSYLQQ
jgi:hypothetical protein